MRLRCLTIAALMVWVAYLAALIAAFVAAYREPSETTAGVASAVVLASLCLAGSALGYALAGRESEGGS